MEVRAPVQKFGNAMHANWCTRHVDVGLDQGQMMDRPPPGLSVSEAGCVIEGFALGIVLRIIQVVSAVLVAGQGCLGAVWLWWCWWQPGLPWGWYGFGDAGGWPGLPWGWYGFGDAGGSQGCLGGGMVLVMLVAARVALGVIWLWWCWWLARVALGVVWLWWCWWLARVALRVVWHLWCWWLAVVVLRVIQHLRCWWQTRVVLRMIWHLWCWWLPILILRLTVSMSFMLAAGPVKVKVGNVVCGCQICWMAGTYNYQFFLCQQWINMTLVQSPLACI